MFTFCYWKTIVLLSHFVSLKNCFLIKVQMTPILFRYQLSIIKNINILWNYTMWNKIGLPFSIDYTLNACFIHIISDNGEILIKLNKRSISLMESCIVKSSLFIKCIIFVVRNLSIKKAKDLMAWEVNFTHYIRNNANSAQIFQKNDVDHH